MTDRDELIEQAVQILHGALCEGGCDTWETFGRGAEAIVDAGWRPPPSGDAVEQAARILHSHGACTCEDLGACLDDAQQLADAGLLRTPPLQATPGCEHCGLPLRDHRFFDDGRIQNCPDEPGFTPPKTDGGA